MRLQGPDVQRGRQLAPLPGALRPHALYALHVRRGKAAAAAAAVQIKRNGCPCTSMGPLMTLFDMIDMTILLSSSSSVNHHQTPLYVCMCVCVCVCPELGYNLTCPSLF